MTNIAADRFGEAPGAQQRPKDTAWLISTFFGIGHLRPGPGTWASAVTTLLWWFVATWREHRGISALIFSPDRWGSARAADPVALAIGALLFTALATIIGIPAATREARRCGVRDPSHVVIDEVAGQMLTLIAAPVQWKTLLAGFILFRCFDILKPPPLRALERLPEGTGIVVDDLGAGVYAWVALRLLLLTPWLQ
jgi:phosphatidylglycerophosphatase A